jgi:GTPase involved in cell partitioning and DNA repair
MIDGAKLLKEFNTEDPNVQAKKIAQGIIRDKEIIDAELYTFSPELAEKKQILVFNKSDLFSEEMLTAIHKELNRIKKEF